MKSDLSSVAPIWFKVAAFVTSLIIGSPLKAADFWELPPINYSTTQATDRLAKLAERLKNSELTHETKDQNWLLKLVLKELEIPIESQLLVFSKTSLQNSLISPESPRAIYFSPNAYVGYVPGGDVEVIIQDPILGPVFYQVSHLGKDISIVRNSQKCMDCHGNARTAGAPGLLVRSVFPGKDGYPLLKFGSHDVDHETPLINRWGGWFVTGKSSMPHLGNRIYDEQSREISPNRNLIKNLDGRIATDSYLRNTSDIVSLLVLEHQVKLHSMLNAASMHFQRSKYLLNILDADAPIEGSSAGSVTSGWVDDLAEYLFFKNEAELGDGVEGNEKFEKAFTQQFPQSAKGERLSDLRLYRRIFKVRCSYMVYSDAFAGLPPYLKKALLVKMKKIISGEVPGYEYLKAAERRHIGEILKDTLPDWTLD